MTLSLACFRSSSSSSRDPLADKLRLLLAGHFDALGGNRPPPERSDTFPLHHLEVRVALENEQSLDQHIRVAWPLPQRRAAGQQPRRSATTAIAQQLREPANLRFLRSVQRATGVRFASP
jgi:hypothetical protein